MRLSIILGHPRSGSFCHAIAATAGAAMTDLGHETVLHDLYAEAFDPIVRPGEFAGGLPDDPLVRLYCQELANADGLVVVHPNWWGGPPAILKGWIDRVVRAGVAYEMQRDATGQARSVPLLKVKAAAIFNPGDATAEAEQTRFGDTLTPLWRNYVGGLCGILQVERHIYAVMRDSTAAQRVAWLDDVKAVLTRLFPAGGQAGPRKGGDHAVTT